MILLKSVLLIAIVVGGMLIGVIPNVLGATYVNDPPNDFSIYYPDEWIVVEPSKMDEFEIGFDNKEDWTTRITIINTEDDWSNKSNKQLIDAAIEVEKEYCASLNFNNSGSLCTNFQYQKELTEINLINGYRTVTVVYSAIMEYDDPNYTEKYPMIFTTTHIIVGNSFWTIFMESDYNVFDYHSKTLARHSTTPREHIKTPTDPISYCFLRIPPPLRTQDQVRNPRNIKVFKLLRNTHTHTL